MGKRVVVADDAIPFLRGILEPWFEVRYLPGGAICASDVKDASALIVRTRTRCDSKLLEGSQVRVVATATIGTDHIDSAWCEGAGIEVASAPGCNSGGVCQYVREALKAIAEKKNISLEGRTLGIVGVGHVGSKVAAMAPSLGLKTLLNDPPLGRSDFVSLDYLLENSDIITLHIPLQGNENFADRHFFARVKPGAIFINASRGEVIDEDALMSVLGPDGLVSAAVIDVWRNEPKINLDLLASADIATPHIAGYSIQGKVNGTTAAVRAIGRRFGIGQLAEFSPETIMMQALANAPEEPYDILSDDAALRRDPSSFEALRRAYRYRNENL